MSLINTQVAPFQATAYHNGQFVPVTEENFKGKWSVVVFYPADFTFVCPTELGDLADHYEEFKRLGVEIYGVSTDTHFTHKAWHDTSDTIRRVQVPAGGRPQPPAGALLRRADHRRRGRGPGAARHFRDRPRGPHQDHRGARQRHRPRRKGNAAPREGRAVHRRQSGRGLPRQMDEGERKTLKPSLDLVGRSESLHFSRRLRGSQWCRLRLRTG